MRRYLRRLGVSVTMVTPMLLGSSFSFAQTRPLQGGVQQNEPAPFVDIIAAGNRNAVATRDGRVYCDWTQGACDELYAYVSAGGTRADCINALKQGVDLERQQQALPKPPAMTALAYASRSSALAQQRDSALARVPRDCFPVNRQPQRNRQTPPASTGCFDAVGRWIEHGLCTPAQADEPPPDLENGTYDILWLTRTGDGKVRLESVGQATVTGDTAYHHSVTVEYKPGVKANSGSTQIQLTSKVPTPDGVASVFTSVPPRRSLLKGAKYVSQRIAVQKQRTERNSQAFGSPVGYNITWGPVGSTPAHEEQWNKLP